MTIMNKFGIASALACAVMLSSCSNFLDREPVATELEQDFWKTEDQAIRALNAAYDPAGWESQEETEWFIGDICSDDADKGGADDADMGEILDLEEFHWSSSNSLLTSLWKDPYQGIYRANLVINNVPGMVLEDAERQASIIGEAKFLRGYYYFQLVKYFGRVPMVLKKLEPTEYYMPRAETEAQCWAQIEKDFAEAAAVLPEEFGGNDLGRATKGAANAFLVKAYMYQKKFALAEPLAAKVIASGMYDLEPHFADIFTLEGQNGTESIFEIQHAETPTSEWGDKNEGQLTSIFQGNKSDPYFEGWGFNRPTDDLVATFELGDVRFKSTIISDGDTLYQGTDDEWISKGGYHAKKYQLQHQTSAPEMSNAPANWRVMRYADLLLFHAEAACENGYLAGAETSLNLVRERAGLTPVTGLAQPALRDTIFHERRVELALEGHRYFDLVRTGRAAHVLEGFEEGANDRFPIPQIEIDLNLAIEQNSY